MLRRVYVLLLAAVIVQAAVGPPATAAWRHQAMVEYVWRARTPQAWAERMNEIPEADREQVLLDWLRRVGESVRPGPVTYAPPVVVTVPADGSG